MFFSHKVNPDTKDFGRGSTSTPHNVRLPLFAVNVLYTDHATAGDGCEAQDNQHNVIECEGALCNLGRGGPSRYLE